ncbi:hypothetical protein AAU61_11555 [Desulfocarbo indianensis]|nr:hypothetical protein AAU61_11555 [Desulfocarbo indianensis]
MSPDVLPGKKVKMEVYAEDAQILREKGQDFQQAIIGKTLGPDDQVLFHDVVIGVTATKPKGRVQVNKDTAIKMSLSKKPMMMVCANCGKELSRYSPTCQECGTEMKVVAL